MSTQMATSEPPRFVLEITAAVLVVDDDVRICNAVRRGLSRDGVLVYAAQNAEEALRRLDEVEVQAVISDLSMPGYDGIWLLSQVRARWPRLQRILLTGVAELDDAMRAVNVARVHSFLTKPWGDDALVEVVRNSVEAWRVGAERDKLLTMLEESNRELENKVRRRTAELERASLVWQRTFDAITDPVILVDRSYQIVRANEAARHVGTGALPLPPELSAHKCHEALFGRVTACTECPLGTDGPRAGAAGRTQELLDGRSGRVWKVTAWPLGDGGPTDVDGAEPGDVSICRYEDVTRERELQRQVAQLEKVAVVGELAGSVAHELNNPLTVILTHSQVLARMDESEDRFLASMAKDIEDGARRCRGIVQSLLDYSRPSGSSARLTPVDLGEILETCLRLGFISQPVSLHVEILRRLPEAPAMVLGSSDSLKSLFLNLINNALQAMNGQGRLRAEMEIDVADQMVVARISDTGPGIPPDMREQVFKSFFTTKAATKTGTGLGLGIARNVVRDHGGTIEISDGPDGGACFTVRIPAHNGGDT